MKLTKAERRRVGKALVGEYISDPTDAEKSEIERRWFAAGRSNKELGRLQGWNRKSEPVMFKEPKKMSVAPEPFFPTIDTLPGEWVNEAACASSPYKDAFHPSYDGTHDPVGDANYAKAVCRTCPVVSSCLTWALEIGPALAGGILGGVSEDERRRMLKRKAAALTNAPSSSWPRH